MDTVVPTMVADLTDPRPDIPDQVRIPVPVGSRVIVTSDLLLGPEPSPAVVAARGALERALGAWDGPGVLVVAGNLLDLAPTGPTGDHPSVTAALSGRAGLLGAMKGFAGNPGRRLIVIPGERDAPLAADAGAAAELTAALGAELAGAIELEMETGAGTRRVEVVAGCDAGPHARSRAAARITGGCAGVVCGSARPELVHLGSGFLARTGTVGEVSEPHRTLPRLPPVELPRRVASWVEVEG
ncbi:MAG TPA: hypothetical protein VGR90_08630, partial [Acidimicrobiales bacterium]|nr:hypothetical protein [Acidimicrobiales bacterium]